MKLIHRFEKWMHPVHTNKVFVAKFVHSNDNEIYTGSWDRTVKFWDIRSDEITNTIKLTTICGDAA